MDGDPFAVAASIVGDLRYPNGIRRRALVVLLTLADAQARKAEAEPETLVEVAELLGELQSYAALSPLEKLFASRDATIRRAAVRALRFLYFKRSFVIVRKALADPDAQVREAALVAIGGLHFPHAFNPLARIYRESTDPRVRAAALQSIGKIQTVEAGEFLVMVLRQESGDAARRRVRRARADGQRRRACRSCASTTRSRPTRRSATRSASCCAGTSEYRSLHVRRWPASKQVVLAAGRGHGGDDDAAAAGSGRCRASTSRCSSRASVILVRRLSRHAVLRARRVGVGRWAAR